MSLAEIIKNVQSGRDSREAARDNPEELWNILKDIIDKLVKSGDLEALNQLYQYVSDEMVDNAKFLLEHGENQRKVKKMIEDNLWRKISD